MCEIKGPKKQNWKISMIPYIFNCTVDKLKLSPDVQCKILSKLSQIWLIYNRKKTHIHALNLTNLNSAKYQVYLISTIELHILFNFQQNNIS